MISDSGQLLPYLPRPARKWAAERDRRHRLIEASLVFADLSGFTTMTERLAATGRRGAEEVSSIISETFDAMLAEAYRAGGSLLKFGGDALLLVFEGDRHERAAAWAAWEMRSALRKRSVFATSAGRIRLGMTSAVSSGPVHMFMVGEPQRELLVAGRAVVDLMALERLATTGQVLVSPNTAAALPSSSLGPQGTDHRQLARRPPPVGEVPVEAPEPAGAIDSFVPAAVRHRLTEGQMSPEHRRIAIGFIGISGLERIIARDPEEAAEALHLVITTTQQVANEHGAWMLASDVASDGAKLIVTAGAPVATGHDEAAVLLTLSQLLDVDSPLTIRLGANHGTAFFGDIGPSYRRTLTVMGDTVNTAARLMAAAPDDAILAAQSMLDSRHVGFALREARQVHLRGRKAPLAVAEVTGPVIEERAHGTGDLLGRDTELAALQASLDSATAGRGAVVEVTGPPGSGRSRLVGEFLNRNSEVGAVRVEASLHERSAAYGLARRLFEGITDIDPEERDSGQRLAALVTQKAPGLLADLGFVSRAMSIKGIDEAILRSTDPRYVQAITTRTIVTLLTAVGPQPLLVAVDDAQLADSASLEILQQLGARADALGWSIVVTLPEGEHLDWSGADVHPVNLGALDSESLTAMAEQLTEDDPLSSHDLAAVVSRSDGNPLVLREIIYARRQNVDIASIPTAVEGLTALRIDQLDPRRRRQLEVASVLGTVFDPALYEMVSGSVRAELIDGWDDGILHETSAGRVRFANPLLRDVVYDRLPFAYRTDLHRTVAETLAKEPDAVEELAFHLFRAERWPEALAASIAAGRDAEEHFASQEAVEWYETALASAHHAPISTSERGDLWSRIGDLRERVGHFGAAAEAFTRAEAAAGTVQDRARLLIRRARPLEKLGRYPAALASLTRARNMAPLSPDVVAMATARYGGVRFYQGRHREAIGLAQETISVSGTETTLPAEALALMILDMARSAIGEPIDGTASRRAMAIFADLGDLDRQARVTNNLGMFAFLAGDWEEAERLYDDSRRTFERIGDEVNASYGTSNLAEIYAAQGRFLEAEVLFREVRRIWRAADDRYGAAYIEGQLGIMAGFAGRIEEAENRLRHSIELFQDIGARAEIAEAACHLIETRLLSGDPEGAREVIESYSLEDPASPTAGTSRFPRLAAVLEWQQGSKRAAEALATALEQARNASAELDELRLLELANRAGLDIADPERQQQLTDQLGMVVSPVYPTKPPSD